MATVIRHAIQKPQSASPDDVPERLETIAVEARNVMESAWGVSDASD
jgi:hypothetical protein